MSASGRIRTCDPRIRSPALYPAELRTREIRFAEVVICSGGQRVDDGIRTRDTQNHNLVLYH